MLTFLLKLSTKACSSYVVEKRNRLKSQMAPTAPLPKEPIGGQQEDYNTVYLRNPKLGTMNMAPTANAPNNNTVPVALPSVAKNFFSFGSNVKDKKRKMTKADISYPTNFMHISHVGWNAIQSFDLTGNENDDFLSKFFAKAGVSEHELKDRDTREFIYDFIHSNNVLGTAKMERSDKPEKAGGGGAAGTATTAAMSASTETTPTNTAMMGPAASRPPKSSSSNAVPPPVPNRQQHYGVNGSGMLSQRTAPPPPPPPPVRQMPPPIPATVPVTSRGPAPPSRPPATPPPPVPITTAVSANVGPGSMIC